MTHSSQQVASVIDKKNEIGFPLFPLAAIGAGRPSAISVARGRAEGGRAAAGNPGGGIAHGGSSDTGAAGAPSLASVQVGGPCAL